MEIVPFLRALNDWGWYADYQYGLYEFKYKDKKKTPKDNWEDNCNYLEDLVDKDLCTYVSSECIEPNETRVIDGVSVFKECWKEKRTYSCVTPFKSDGKCSNLRAQGCFQINSKCTQYKKGICVKYEQTFKCPISKKLKVTKINSGKAPFCIGGDCVTPNYAPNTEMMEAISRLEVLRKIQEDLRADAVKIFDGKNPQKCSRYIVNFKDCCMKTKGWGVSAHLSQCSAEEKILSKNRSKNLCVFVGTYCAEKVLGKCIRKKSSFCCFGSKLARIIHEQGRPQLGISWGDAKHPQCRGFSQEEIANLDFSKFDLSELYEELMSRYKEKDLSSYVSQKPNLLQNIDTQIKLIQKELSLPKDKNPEKEM